MSPPVSVQLYSLREEAERDFPRLIERLGQLGYVGVEPSGLHGLAPTEFRRLVEEAGMRVSSAHGPLPVGDDANRILDDHSELGTDTLMVPYLPWERFKDLAAVQATADDLNRAAELARGHRMVLGYHNHWWEFQTVLDGRTAYDHLFERLSPDIVAELDVYWAKVGNADPVGLLQRLGDRARYLHLKDGPADDPASAMVALGEGSFDVKGVVRAARAARWHVVELVRCDSDPFEAVQKSLAYLIDNGLSRGRG